MEIFGKDVDVKFESQKTEIETVFDNGNAAMITKVDSNGNKHQILVLNHKYKNVYLVGMIVPGKWIEENGVDELFVPYCHNYSGDDANIYAYNKFLHLVGKMCQKNCDSKYFSQYKTEEHRKNGGGMSSAQFLEFQCYAKEMLERFSDE